MKYYTAWLDDVFTPDDQLRNPDGMEFDVIWKDTYEAEEYIKANGCPAFISFDHDLGNEEDVYPRTKPTGHDLAKWLVERDIESGGTFLYPSFEFRVHSQNPTGAENIYYLLTNYLRVRGF